MTYGRSPQLSVALQMKYLPSCIYFIFQDLLMSLFKLESSEATEWRKEIKQKVHTYLSSSSVRGRLDFCTLKTLRDLVASTK